MKVKLKENASEHDVRDVLEYYGDYRVRKSAKAKQIKSPNDLTDDVIKLLVDDCCECSRWKIPCLARDLRLLNKLTDYAIKLFINNCLNNCLTCDIPKIAEQIRLANKLTIERIELLIDKCRSTNIPTLVQQFPDNYKPTDEVIRLLDGKGYEVLE